MDYEQEIIELNNRIDDLEQEVNSNSNDIEFINTFVPNQMNTRPQLYIEAGVPWENSSVDMANRGAFYLDKDSGVLYQRQQQTGFGIKEDWANIEADPESGGSVDQDIIMPVSEQVDYLLSSTYEVNDDRSIIAGDIKVVSADTGRNAYRDDTKITATIDESGFVEFNISPQQDVIIVYNVMSAVGDLPKDFLFEYFKNDINEKNVSSFIDDLSSLENDISKQAAKPLGLYVKETDHGPTLSINYLNDDSINHFVIERYNEETEEWQPYDGENGIVYPESL